MAEYRLARRAAADLAEILSASEDQWGPAAKRRYEQVLGRAMRRVATDPEGPMSRDQAHLIRGLRSFHVRHARARSGKAQVRHPVHILFYRIVAPGIVEIVRILHERMEPGRHLGEK